MLQRFFLTPEAQIQHYKDTHDPYPDTQPFEQDELIDLADEWEEAQKHLKSEERIGRFSRIDGELLGSPRPVLVLGSTIMTHQGSTCGA